jgi:hemerythrin-like domain-containing protein
VLLIYDEAATRLERRELAAAALAADAAQIVKRFVEAYHEQLEEAFVFPRLEGDPRHGPLVRTLIEQHEKGRAATTEILRLSQSKDAPGLARHLRSFSRMYRAHAAWEDSVLFPAFRGAVGAGEYRDLGEKFEEEERQRFGEHGFEEMLAQVSRIEHGLDIAELSKFTPA